MPLHTKTATKAAIKAGNAILSIYNDEKRDLQTEAKADDSPLTIADRRAHEIIVQELEATGLPVLSEEGIHLPYAERKKWTRFWLVDPLDGTREFINRNGEFTVNIALIERNRPVMGVICVPVTGLVYLGVMGEGVWRSSKTSETLGTLEKWERLGASGTSEAPETLGALEKWESVGASGTSETSGGKSGALVVLGSRSHMSSETQEYIEDLKARHGEVEFVPVGSSLKFCLMAEGKADIYPRLGKTMEWDTAAGQAIAEAAGKQVLRIDNGKPLRYNKENLQNPYFVVK